jgi:polyhydroxybutyrate depolymerase
VITLATMWLAAVLGACNTPPEPAVIRTEQLESGGLTRTYTLYVPSSYRPAGHAPVLIAFHGGGGTGSGMREAIGGDRLADRYGVLTVYPDAVSEARHLWALGCAYCTWGDVLGIDDFQFAWDLIATLAARYSIDRSRIYVLGHSTGGSFAADFACQASSILAGVAAVSSLPTPEELAGCAPARPLPVLVMLGDEDPNVPWSGGGTYGYLSADSTAQLWAQWNGCSQPPRTSVLPDQNHDGRAVSVLSYEGCQNGSFVRLFRIEGGGHVWPTGDLDATDLIGETFFGSAPR